MNMEDMLYYNDNPIIMALGTYEDNLRRIEEADLTPEERKRNLRLLEKIEEAKRKTA